MLDPIIMFFERLFLSIGRGFGRLVAWILWPFLTIAYWYRQRGWVIKLPIGLAVIGLVLFYGHFIWMTQAWTNFDPKFVDAYKYTERGSSAGTQLTAKADGSGPATCQKSAIAEVSANLIDFNVNQNEWVSSMLAYKLGFFGIDWDHTPFLDNKANFQRGVNEAVRRTTVELVDSLVRMRGTSGINNQLQSARSKMQYEETNWYFGWSPFGFLTPTPVQYRAAIADLNQFNTDLGNCAATFDERSDNLLEFMDRVANSIGSTSAMLKDRSENFNGGWFDTRADDRFWFAYGQLYGYYAIMTAVRADFDGIIKERNLAPLWGEMLKQFQAALRIQPLIISNGKEDGWIMPTHLATMGFYTLRVRSNLVEIRDVLNR